MQILLSVTVSAQMIEGYAYESGNRGYLNVVHVQLIEKSSGALISDTFSDLEGRFEVDLPPQGDYQLIASKEMFETRTIEVDRSTTVSDKIFVKLEMKRSPGYIFDVTIAPTRANEDIAVDGIKGARIEVYNNTTKEEILLLPEHPIPSFKLPLQKGNHYTILIRKEGYLAKRMEAYVNVKGCILCFEGVGDVQPGVADNLSEGNNMGILLANVEMEPSFEGKKMAINNIYYDLDKASLRADSEEELQAAIYLMTDNPTIAVEIGSHTDSRGKTDYNQRLSEERAQAVVNYLVQNGDIDKDRLIYKGYGESQIINRCTNGVKCSEAEHQANRRTEMKIIGEVAAPELVPLAEMKRLEQMDALIEELQNQEQVVVNSEKELNQLLTAKESVTSDSQTARNSTESQHTSNLPLDDDLDNRNLVKEEESKQDSKKSKVTTPKLSEGVSDDKALSERNLRLIAERRRKRIEAQLNNSLKKNQPNTTNQSAKIESSQKESPSASSQVATDTVAVAALARGLDGEPITGYMVVIKETDQQLSTETDIFRRHSTVYSYAMNNQYLYMLGRYPTQQSAERELNAFLSKTYPAAYILEFEKGQISQIIK